MKKIVLAVFLWASIQVVAVLPGKVLICGVCKNVESAAANTIASMTALGQQFSDYKVVIYENNSKDHTTDLFHKWAQENPHVVFISERVKKRELVQKLAMKRLNRTELIARARNCVLDEIMKECYADYKYVVWADLDLLEPWDVQGIVETIQYPEQEWDAVLANGSYDLFAFRDQEFPIGFELVGDLYWDRLDQIRSRFSMQPTDPWRKVYSAFGGLGVYKRESILGCRYSGVVTRDLEAQVVKWLSLIRSIKEVPLLKEYEELLASSSVINFYQSYFLNRQQLPSNLGMRLKNSHGLGRVVWFSCLKNQTLPSVCEHIPFHAAMAARGHDRIFINPRLRSNHP